METSLPSSNGSTGKGRRLVNKHVIGTVTQMKIGRNDPCPCGSGKKYKRCCMVNDEAAQTTNRTLDNEWLKLRQTEGEMVHLLLHVARDWYGEDFLKHAWQEYTRQSSESLKIGEAPET